MNSAFVVTQFQTSHVTVNVNVAYNAMGRRGRQNGAVTERGVEAKTNCECEESAVPRRHDDNITMEIDVDKCGIDAPK
ncbi:hypothetical protein F2P81_007601 [Scophthalmus maximus]|uniref:Uncharacterized protein n=1 Tax=Scophthalmus maximus TaxID=52904 RepID=A0A6A4SVU1_SCOMX|nr:hypothetical protein F2P81_007601 [Scophthalmus maximus]